MEFETVKADTRIAIQEEVREGNESPHFQDKTPQAANGQPLLSSVNNGQPLLSSVNNGQPLLSSVNNGQSVTSNGNNGQSVTSNGNNGQSVSSNVNRTSVHQPTRPLPVYAPRRTKNFVARRCDPLIRLFKWFPVLFISAVLSWGYYAYVVQLCYLTIESVIVKIIYLLVFHVLYGMTFWSYYQTIFTEAGRVPREFWFTVTDIERLNAEVTEDARRVVCESIVRERNLPILCRTYSGGFRICEKCNLLKPDRAHHCSVCDACVLKMDHHCPWVNNCVSFTNYKFFVLFLGYAFSLCSWSAVTSFEYFLRFWKNDLPSSYSKLHILFLFFVSIMFAVSLVSLYLYHLFLVFKNRSTLESFRTPIFRYGPDKRAYDLGRRKNWKQVFGETRLTWFVPVSSCQGTGLKFQTRVSQMMGSDLPFDGEDDDQYPEGKLPLLSAEEPSTDSEEVVFNKSQVKSRDENSSLHADQDQMVTVNLSEDEPDFTEIITRDQKANSNPKDVRLLIDD